MQPSRAFDLTNDVALVTGAGSRMDGKRFALSFPETPSDFPSRTAVMLTQSQTTGEIGNGRAAAILLARHGAKVALVDFNVDWAKETKRMIDEEGGISEVIQADVTNEESCKAAVEKTVALWGELHILVNIGKSCGRNNMHGVLWKTTVISIGNECLFVRSGSRGGSGRCHRDRSQSLGPRHAHQLDKHGVDEPIRHSRNEKGGSGIHCEHVIRQRL